MTTEQLKCCPFCGGEAKVEEVEAAGYCIICTDSTCMTSSNIRYACGDDPIPLLTEQWNRRTPELSAQTAVKTEQPSLSDAEILAFVTNGHWRDGDGLLTFSSADLIERVRALLAQRQDSDKDAERFRWIEENCHTEGGGKGFTIFVPVDHEDIGCGIDQAIANGAPK